MKYKNRPYARYRWREKHKKVYTFTKTKFIAGFFLSVFVSIFLGSYIDRYGLVVMKQTAIAFENAMAQYHAEQEQTPPAPPDPSSTASIRAMLAASDDDAAEPEPEQGQLQEAPEPPQRSAPTLFPERLLRGEDSAE